MLGIEPRAFCVLSKGYTMQLHSKPTLTFMYESSVAYGHGENHVGRTGGKGSETTRPRIRYSLRKHTLNNPVSPEGSTFQFPPPPSSPFDYDSISGLIHGLGESSQNDFPKAPSLNTKTKLWTQEASDISNTNTRVVARLLLRRLTEGSLEPKLKNSLGNKARSVSKKKVTVVGRITGSRKHKVEVQ